MKLANLALIVALSAVTAFGVVKVATPTAQNPAAAKETRLEQIKRTGVLRCGYMIWPPVVVKDPNTGKMSGLAVELLEEIGKQLNVKIDWSVESTVANAFVDMANNRFDIVCSPYFVTPARAREAGFTTPFLFHPAYLYVRADDARFDNNYAAANDPAVKFSTIDGEFSAVGADENFPKAQKVALPQNATSADMFLNIADKKADVVVTEPMTFDVFNNSNPNKLKRAAGSPLRVMAISFPLPAKEYDLKNTLDATLTFLQGSGFLDTLADKYDSPTFKFLRLPKAYVDAN